MTVVFYISPNAFLFKHRLLNYFHTREVVLSLYSSIALDLQLQVSVG